MGSRVSTGGKIVYAEFKVSKQCLCGNFMRFRYGVISGEGGFLFDCNFCDAPHILFKGEYKIVKPGKPGSTETLISRVY